MQKTNRETKEKLSQEHFLKTECEKESDEKIKILSELIINMFYTKAYKPESNKNINPPI